ncbi:MAG: 4Fe-4S ferredoxin [Thermoprotei archaeon]|nr:MAG: 4Fe-4S ferredoxin [Thermoprotei archaeon]
MNRFMSYNVASREIRRRKRLLIYGSCLAVEHPEIVKEYSQNRVALAVCMEETHVNMFITKLAGVLARVDLEEITVLSVDGSLHCVQLHTGVEEALKISGKKLPVKHLVYEKERVIEVNPRAVKISRYLSKINNLLRKNMNEH